MDHRLEAVRATSPILLSPLHHLHQQLVLLRELLRELPRPAPPSAFFGHNARVRVGLDASCGLLPTWPALPSFAPLLVRRPPGEHAHLHLLGERLLLIAVPHRLTPGSRRRRHRDRPWPPSARPPTDLPRWARWSPSKMMQSERKEGKGKEGGSKDVAARKYEARRDAL